MGWENLPPTHSTMMVWIYEKKSYIINSKNDRNLHGKTPEEQDLYDYSSITKNQYLVLVGCYR